MSDSLFSGEKRTCGLRFTDDFLQLFCEKNSDGSKRLRLKGNELSQRFDDRVFPADMVFVAEFIRNHPSINELDISYNPIEDKGVEHLCETLFKFSDQLEHLNLGNCDITTPGAKLLCSTAQECKLKLKTLRMTGNALGEQGSNLIILMMLYVPTMEYLDMGDTNQTMENAENLFQTMYTSENLKVLDLSRLLPKSLYHAIDDTFLPESMSEFFRLSKSIVELRAQKCALDAHGVETMLDGLQQNKSLRFLDIGFNNICCVGVEFLADWLLTRPELTGLCLAGNNIRNYGARALSHALPFTKMRYLDLSQNNIGDEGITDILYTLKKPYLMRYLLIWGNKFTHKTNKIIQRMMKSKVFEQDWIDVKIYCVDNVLYAARYPINKYKHRYYGVMDHGCAVELKIKRNRIETEACKPRALVNFKYIDRHPPIDPEKCPPAEYNKFPLALDDLERYLRDIGSDLGEMQQKWSDYYNLLFAHEYRYLSQYWSLYDGEYNGAYDSGYGVDYMGAHASEYTAYQNEHQGEDLGEHSGAQEREYSAVLERESIAAQEDEYSVAPQDDYSVVMERESIGAQEGEPSIAQEDEPSVAQEGEPSVAQEGEPGAVQEDEPSVVQEAEPAVPQEGEGEPSAAQEGEPSAAQQGEPSVAQEGEPSAAQEDESSPAQEGQ